MSLIIDGYNLIHATGMLSRGVGPGSLERARNSLLGFLTRSLDPAELARTKVVFDAKNAPSDLEDTVRIQGMQIYYAKGYDDADELIEELIHADSAPRKLTVVSSDHGVQKVAKRRRATAIDSDKWFQDIRETSHQHPQPDAEPNQDHSPEAVQRWIEVFEKPKDVID